MEIRYLRLIKAIAEEGSIAGSSGKLFLTQSALSHQLRELEARLGFKAFRRSRNNWELTEEGGELYKMACKVIDDIEKGLDTIELIRKGSTGRIRVGTECYSFYQGLPSFIQKMGVLYPGIDVDLVLEATHHPVSKVLSNEIDIAVVTSKPNEEALTSIEVHEDEIFALVHRECPLFGLDHLEAVHFTVIPLIIHSFLLETVSVHQRYLRPNGITPVKVTAVPLTEVALEMVGANMGMMCMPKWALAPFNLPKDVGFKRIGRDGLKRTHYLVVRKADARKKYIGDFLLNFEEHFQGLEGSFNG